MGGFKNGRDGWREVARSGGKSTDQRRPQRPGFWPAQPRVNKEVWGKPLGPSFLVCVHGAGLSRSREWIYSKEKAKPSFLQAPNFAWNKHTQD